MCICVIYSYKVEVLVDIATRILSIDLICVRASKINFLATHFNQKLTELSSSHV